MTDLEIVKKCAEKMGIDVSEHVVTGVLSLSENIAVDYDPLTNDAQAMALVKRFNFVIEREKCNELFGVTLFSDFGNYKPTIVVRAASDLNRAICECVAKLP